MDCAVVEAKDYPHEYAGANTEFSLQRTVLFFCISVLFMQRQITAEVLYSAGRDHAL